MLKKSREAQAAVDGPEVELLLHCVRPDLDAERVGRIQTLAAGGATGLPLRVWRAPTV